MHIIGFSTLYLFLWILESKDVSWDKSGFNTSSIRMYTTDDLFRMEILLFCSKWFYSGDSNMLGMQSISRSPLAVLGFSLLATLVTICLRSPFSCVSTQFSTVRHYNVEYTIQETTCPKSAEAVIAEKCPLMECEFAVSLDRLYLYLFLKSSL